MALHNVHIEKLSKENYETWKLQMKAILIQNDFWEYVDGSEQPPENENELVAHNKSDQKAKASIILSMSPSELCYVKHCASAREVWLKLQDVYQSKMPEK